MLVRCTKRPRNRKRIDEETIVSKEVMEWWRGDVKPDRREAKTYIETLRCPVCEKGEMKYLGSQWATGPYGYHHKCDACGEMLAISGQHFPRTVVE